MDISAPYRIITRPFRPKGEKFFDLFEQGTANLVETAKIFHELVEKWEDVDKKVAKIADLEHKGDNITHTVIANLHSTFFTPLDREDITSLTEALDDVVDFIKKAADEMLVYRVKRPTSSAIELAEIIVEAALQLEKAIPNLRRRRLMSNVHSYCIELQRLENVADRVQREALCALFDDQTDPLDVIKWREIYEHMETATDRCEDVANVLEGVALKHA
jgi:predicted phosphate transport protein (TIGR00153 family)